MTEKRFTTLESGIDYGVIDNATDERLFDVDITELLNMLHEENQQLRKDAKYWQKSSAYWSRQESKTDIENDKLREENEQLKQSMNKLFDYFAKWFEEERGTHIEDFCSFWEDIQKGEDDD